MCHLSMGPSSLILGKVCASSSASSAMLKNSVALEFVTSGIARATSHRVLSPSGDPKAPGGANPRYSVPFFQNISLTVRLTEEVLECKCQFALLMEIGMLRDCYSP